MVKYSLIPVLMVLVNCTMGTNVRVEQQDPLRPVFVLEKSSPFIGPTPAIYHLDVFCEKDGQFDWENPLWDIRTDRAFSGGGSYPLRNVVYGEVPEPFNETVSAQVLEPGMKCYVGVSGYTRGRAYFTVGKAKKVKVDKQAQ